MSITLEWPSGDTNGFCLTPSTCSRSRFMMWSVSFATMPLRGRGPETADRKP